MKNGKKPTVAQSKLMSQWGLNYRDWLVAGGTTSYDRKSRGGLTMANEVRLIEELRRLADLTPPICCYDRPEETEIFGKKITIYCKPFEQFQDTLRQAADRIEELQRAFNRLGKFGRLFLDYKGCPRGPVGRMGEPYSLEYEATYWRTIKDVDGGRWVPVVEDVLHELIAKANDPDSLRPKGRWILEAHNESVNCRWNVTAECSECCDEKKEIWAGFFPGVPDSMAREVSLMDAKQVKLSNYCPNCGADMREGEG